MRVDLDQTAIRQLVHDPAVQAELQRRTELGAASAKSHCPVRTGRARDSIHAEHQADGSWQLQGGGQGVDYFEYIEYGTRYDPAQHPLLKAADAVRAG